jgi:hypothetical protein
MLERLFRDPSTERLERGVFRSAPESIAAIGKQRHRNTPGLCNNSPVAATPAPGW